jgi:hypothetical protein
MRGHGRPIPDFPLDGQNSRFPCDRFGIWGVCVIAAAWMMPTFSRGETLLAMSVEPASGVGRVV